MRTVMGLGGWMIDGKDEWGTPMRIFRRLDREFILTLDPCGVRSRELKKDLITLDIREGGDGLKYNWKDHSVFVNPPYSADNIMKWVKKAFSEKDRAECIVMLIPVRSDRKYFHRYIINQAEIRFVKGRPSFIPLNNQNDGSPCFPSMLIIWRKNQKPKEGLFKLTDFIPEGKNV